jgi:4a-hydroxytetrahydrobiopterin dehydratase
MNPLINKHCRHYSDQESVLNLSQIEQLRQYTPLWQFCATENELYRTFHFDNFASTMKFVNTVANIAHKHDHHPQMIVTYNRCKVGFRTHSVNGITENDFICANAVDEQLSNTTERAAN